MMQNKSFSSGTPKGGHMKETWSLISSTTVLPFNQYGEMGNFSIIPLSIPPSHWKWIRVHHLL
jgi:hypothetical protein